MFLENRQSIQKDLSESVSEVLDILRRQRPDLHTSIFSQLAEMQELLTRDPLSDDNLKWIHKTIGYLCHFKCLYDFCPLELSEGETDQERWQRWGQILDRMKIRSELLCGRENAR